MGVLATLVDDLNTGKPKNEEKWDILLSQDYYVITTEKGVFYKPVSTIANDDHKE